MTGSGDTAPQFDLNRLAVRLFTLLPPDRVSASGLDPVARATLSAAVAWLNDQAAAQPGERGEALREAAHAVDEFLLSTVNVAVTNGGGDPSPMSARAKPLNGQVNVGHGEGNVVEHGIAWYAQAHAAASRRGLTSALVDAYRTPDSVEPDPAGKGRTRRWRDGVGVVVSEDGVVLAFRERELAPQMDDLMVGLDPASED